MGYGEVGGDGSVNWTFMHHDKASGQPKKIKCKSTGKPGTDEVSVEGTQAQGHDPILFSEIGRRMGKAPYFRVTLAGHGTFDVLAVDRTGGMNAGVPMEIRIEW